MNREDTVIYLAGFFDGEGSVMAYTRWNRSGSQSVAIEIAVTQVLEQPLLVFRQTFGGIVQWNNNGWYQWRAYSKDAAKALYEMLPWLINKQMQARLALQLDARISRRLGLPKKVPEGEMAIRLEMVTQLKAMKDEHSISRSLPRVGG